MTTNIKNKFEGKITILFSFNSITSLVVHSNIHINLFAPFSFTPLYFGTKGNSLECSVELLLCFFTIELKSGQTLKKNNKKIKALEMDEKRCI